MADCFIKRGPLGGIRGKLLLRADSSSSAMNGQDNPLHHQRYKKSMKGVLGIDAAWVEKNESGVALIVQDESSWRVKACGHSILDFCAQLDPSFKVEDGTTENGIRLAIKLANEVCQGDLSLIAVDMPLSKKSITGRRAADNKVSKAYWAEHCSTHSPTDPRLSESSERLRVICAEQGFTLCPERIVAPALIEVYPHPALVELCKESERLRYKVNNMARLHKDLPKEDRPVAVEKIWRRIAECGEKDIKGFSKAVDEAIQAHKISKRGEDLLDALVCAWIGLTCLEGRAIPFGDEDASIWIPKPL
jgi:predicted RNase H-like nuclease